MGRRKPPTPKGKEVLDKIRELVGKTGETTQAEVFAVLGWNWPNSVKVLLDKLETSGWIEREKHRPGVSRAIRITKHQARASMLRQSAS